MPGSLEVRVNGQVGNSFSLPEVDLPPVRGSFAYGDPVKVELRNAGTTTIRNIRIQVRGQGSENVCLGKSRSPTVSDPIGFSEDLAPGKVYDLWARARYGHDEPEDGKSFELVVTAKSVG